MDINNYFELYSAEEMLAAMPRNYTKEMALCNNDILDTQTEDYNFERLDQFIENVNLGIPDTVIITRFGIDDIFYGYKIYTDFLQRYGVLYKTYNLIRSNNNVFQFASKNIKR